MNFKISTFLGTFCNFICLFGTATDISKKVFPEE